MATEVAAKTSTGTFDEDDLRTLSAADRAFIAELQRARPGASVPATGRIPHPTHEMEDEPALPVNKMLMRATIALEQVAGWQSGLGGVQTQNAQPKFKLLATQSRVQQDALNKTFNDDPARVVAEFEAAVRGLAGVDPDENSRVT